MTGTTEGQKIRGYAYFQSCNIRSLKGTSFTRHIRPVIPGDAGGAMTLPGFGRSVIPISTRREDYAHHITTAPGFSYPAHRLCPTHAHPLILLDFSWGINPWMFDQKQSIIHKDTKWLFCLIFSSTFVATSAKGPSINYVISVGGYPQRRS